MSNDTNSLDSMAAALDPAHREMFRAILTSMRLQEQYRLEALRDDAIDILSGMLKITGGIDPDQARALNLRRRICIDLLRLRLASTRELDELPQHVPPKPEDLPKPLTQPSPQEADPPTKPQPAQATQPHNGTAASHHNGATSNAVASRLLAERPQKPASRHRSSNGARKARSEKPAAALAESRAPT